MGRRIPGGACGAVAVILLAALLAGCGFGSGDESPATTGAMTTTTTGGALPDLVPLDGATTDRAFLDGGFAPYEEPVVGGVLQAAVGDAETCWNGLSAGPASRALFTLIGRGLYGYPPTLREPAAHRLRPNAAVDLPLVEDEGLRVTVVLRAGLRFPDGTAVTAAAAKESMEFMLDPRTQCPGGGPLAAGSFAALAGLDAYVEARSSGDEGGVEAARESGIAGIEVVDERTIAFRLERPDPWFPHALAAPWAILRAPGAPRNAVAPAVGLLGPYRIAAYEPGARLVVEREERWAANVAAGLPGGPGENLIDGIDLAIAVPSATQLAQLVEDELDLSLDGSAPNAAALGSVLDEPALRPRLFSTPAETLVYLALRADRAPLSDERLRRAINLAVDRRALARILGGDIAASPWSALLPADLLGDHPARPFRRDPAAARALVRRAEPPAGPRLLLTSPADATSTAIAERVERDLERVGFRVARTVVTTSEYAAYVADPGSDYDLAVSTWGPAFGDASTVLGPLLVCGRTDNLGGFCDADADARYAEVAAAPLGASRDARFAAFAADLGREQVPLAVLVERRWVSLVGSRVGNYRWGPVRLADLSTLSLRP